VNVRFVAVAGLYRTEQADKAVWEHIADLVLADKAELVALA